MCKDQDKWYHFNILPFVPNNHRIIIILKFYEAFVKVWAGGGFLEMVITSVNIANRSNPLTQMTMNDDKTTNTTIDPPSSTLTLFIFNIHHIPSTIGNLSYVKCTIACNKYYNILFLKSVIINTDLIWNNLALTQLNLLWTHTSFRLNLLTFY